MAGRVPSPSAAITGTPRNVASDHAPGSGKERIPTILANRQITRIGMETNVEDSTA